MLSVLFWGCFSIRCHTNKFLVMSSCTQEGYKCITLAVAVQEGLLFGRYFFRSRSQGVATLVSESEMSRLVYDNFLLENASFHIILYHVRTSTHFSFNFELFFACLHYCLGVGICMNKCIIGSTGHHCRTHCSVLSFFRRVFFWSVQCSVVHCMWVRGG